MNKIDKTFGPLAFSGVLLFACILLMFLYELTFYIRTLKNEVNQKINFEIDNATPLIILVLLLLLGAFVGFTTNCVRVDYVKKRIKYVIKLFGIVPIGKWTYLTTDMKLGLKKSTKRWRANSRSNRTTLLDYTDLKIVLYDSRKKEIVPLKKVKKAKFAEEELEKMSKLLKLSVI